MATNGNAIGTPFLKSNAIPPAIRNSMILWYDLKKQGATNETMSTNPILKDLSGNGHHATCYNFAWTEESGISTTNYPNALVSDGVDDYAQVTGLPLLNKEDGYTVIAKRKWISDLNVNQGLLCKTTDSYFGGAFALEGIIGNGTMKVNFSFGATNKVEEFESSDITYLTSNSYNGKLIKSGSLEDTDFIEIFRARELYCSAALYSLLLFNRDLTDNEIEWVKNNLFVTDLGDFNNDFNNDFNIE